MFVKRFIRAIRRRTERAVVLLLALTLLAPPVVAAAGDSHPCQPAFDEALAKLPLTNADIRSYAITTDGSGGRVSMVLGYSAWLGLKSCKGSVVIRVDSSCDFMQTYVKGDCQVAGLHTC